MKNFWKHFLGNFLVLLVGVPIITLLVVGPAVGITQLFIGEDGNVETTGLVLAFCFLVAAASAIEALFVTIRERSKT